MRGLHSEQTAEIMTSAFRNYYNFIRPHSVLGMTPALKAGIGVEMEGNRWMALLKKVFKYGKKKETSGHKYNILIYFLPLK
mgnify:CR=1 FL=1